MKNKVLLLVFMMTIILGACSHKAVNVSDLFDNTYWHDGFYFCHATVAGDTLRFEGGTLHEGGFEFAFRITPDGRLASFDGENLFDSIALKNIDGLGNVIELFDAHGSISDRFVQYQCDGDTSWGFGFRQIYEGFLDTPLQGRYTDGNGRTLSIGNRLWIWTDSKSGKSDTLHYHYVCSYDFPSILAVGGKAGRDRREPMGQDSYYDWLYTDEGLEIYRAVPFDPDDPEEWYSKELLFTLVRQPVSEESPWLYPFLSTTVLYNQHGISCGAARAMVDELMERRGNNTNDMSYIELRNVEFLYNVIADSVIYEDEEE